MGSAFDCFKARNRDPKPENQQNPPPNHYAPPKMNRINDTDKAILDVKARMRKIKTYIDKINLQLEQQNTKIKDFLKDKQKQRALIALKHKKFLEKESDKAAGAQSMLQQTINNIESAQMDVNVMDALKVGDQIITELQSKASLEDFQDLYERHQDQKEKMEMEQELFGKIMDEDELQDELDALEAMEVDQQIPDAPHTIIEVDNQPVRVQNQQQRQQQQSNQDREMVPA